MQLGQGCSGVPRELQAFEELHGLDPLVAEVAAGSPDQKGSAHVFSAFQPAVSPLPSALLPCMLSVCALGVTLPA